MRPIECSTLSKSFQLIPEQLMSVLNKLKRAARGEVEPTTAAREALRRARIRLSRRADIRLLQQATPLRARLRRPFAEMSEEQLLSHFRSRTEPSFFPAFRDPQTKTVQRELFPSATAQLIASANQIAADHRWPLLGFGEKNFGEEIEWRRDPLSGYLHPLVYHRDVQLRRNDGSDARVLWELNRLGHMITLGRAYAVSGDETLSAEFVKQTNSWIDQNPFGQGINWNCAMEVALRGMNLLTALELFRGSPQLTSESISKLLTLLDQHGTFIRRNLEFSYLATSNHYFTDVVGLLWLGIMLPELSDATEWREVGFREMLAEMDKQILPDGADFESSTGYHRLILELLLYSFLLCRSNGIEIKQRHWDKLRAMLEYVRFYVRPDGFAPLIGDSDSGQVLPIRHRSANDHAYLLPLGAVTFNDPQLKSKDAEAPEELLWLLGSKAIATFEALPSTEFPPSNIFPYAGTHIIRDSDLYLCFNTSGAGIQGRGSHGHNDALSIEVSACGRPFIVDPGTYSYTGDLSARHQFRSTPYHSTAEIDGQEQNTIDINAPFVIGDEAQSRLLLWETNEHFDRVVAEHRGYSRLPNAVIHKRTINLDKKNRYWSIDDEFVGEAENKIAIRFHFDARLEMTSRENLVSARDLISGSSLIVCAVTLKSAPLLEVQATSRDYGEQQPSITACWNVTGRHSKLQWLIVPVCSRESEAERLQVCKVAVRVSSHDRLS
jgi:hypothetical protein